MFSRFYPECTGIQLENTSSFSSVAQWDVKKARSDSVAEDSYILECFLFLLIYNLIFLKKVCDKGCILINIELITFY